MMSLRVSFQSVALRKAKIARNFGLFECYRVNLYHFHTMIAYAG